jgi:hypothetical protein
VRAGRGTGNGASCICHTVSQERAVKVYNSKYSKIISSFVARARASCASFGGLGWHVAGAPLSRAEFRTS